VGQLNAHATVILPSDEAIIYQTSKQEM